MLITVFDADTHLLGENKPAQHARCEHVSQRRAVRCVGHSNVIYTHTRSSHRITVCEAFANYGVGFCECVRKIIEEFARLSTIGLPHTGGSFDRRLRQFHVGQVRGGID